MPGLIEIGLVNAALAAVLAAIVWLVTRVVRNPVLVHSLWVIVLLKLVTPPIVSIPWSYAERTAYSADSAGSSADVTTTPVESALIHLDAKTSQPVSISDAAAPPKTLAAPINATPDLAARGPLDEHAIRQQTARAWPTISPGMIAAVWVSGSAMWLIVSVIRMTQFHRALGDTMPASREMCDLADRVAARLGVARRFRLRITEGRLSPLVWPIGRPTIVLSRPLVADLSSGETETLLAHEFAHLRRKDHWVRWLEMSVTVLYWWNPVVWWSRANIHRAEEQACDAWVVRAFPDAAKRYASALFTAMQFVSDSPSTPPLVASRLDVGGNFKERIENIMSGNCDRRLSFRHKLSVLVLALLVLPLSLHAVSAADEPATPEGAVEVTADLKTNQAPTPVSVALPSSGPASVALPSSNIEKEIERQLQTPVKLDFVEVPLEEIMRHLENSVGLDIHFDKVGLDQEGISGEEPVTIDLKNKVALRSALNLILKPLHLTFAIEDEVLKITSEKQLPAPVVKDITGVGGNTVTSSLARGKTNAQRGAVPPTRATSAEEIEVLREHVKFLESQFNVADAKLQTGARGGEAVNRDMTGYELATAQADLAQAESRLEEVAKHLKEAEKLAEEAFKSVRASYDSGRITLDVVLQAAKNLADSKRRLLHFEQRSSSSIDDAQNAFAGVGDTSRQRATLFFSPATTPSIRFAKKQIEIAKSDYERAQSLAQRKIISVSEFDQRKFDYERSVEQLRQSERALDYNRLLVELAETEYQQALEANQKTPNSVSELEIRKLRIKVDLAKNKLREIAE